MEFAGTVLACVRTEVFDEITLRLDDGAEVVIRTVLTRAVCAGARVGVEAVAVEVGPVRIQFHRIWP